MTNSTIAPTLSATLSSFNPAIRAQVINHLINRPRIQGQWLGDEGEGCFWAIAVTGVTGMSAAEFSRGGHYDMIERSAKTFGVDRNTVVATFSEWDTLEPNELDEFIANLRVQAAMARAQAIASRVSQVPVGVIAAARAKIGQLVNA